MLAGLPSTTHWITSFKTLSPSCYSFLNLFPSMISCLVSGLMLSMAGQYPASLHLSLAISAGSHSRSVAYVILSSPTSLSAWYSSFSSFVGTSQGSDLDNASMLTFSISFLCITMNSYWAKSANQCWKMLSSDFMLTIYFRLCKLKNEASISGYASITPYSSLKPVALSL